jgi:Polyketide cyclase / dehydrase and lipid transport
MGTLKRTSRVEVVTDASPEAVWAVVSDVTRVGDWSHECRTGEWVDGATAARAGARFRGRNRIDRRGWTRLNEVVSVDEPRELVWKTVPTALFPDSTRWSITVEPVAGGTRIVQRYEILKLNPLLDRLFYLTTPKHRDRTAALTDDMRALGEVARSGVPQPR